MYHKYGLYPLQEEIPRPYHPCALHSQIQLPLSSGVTGGFSHPILLWSWVVTVKTLPILSPVLCFPSSKFTTTRA